MNRDLLDVLADPDTKEPLRLGAVRDERNGQIIEGDLLSASGRVFPVVRGIPRFVSAESYAANFGIQWNAFRQEQLDAEQGSSFSRQRFETETGWTDDELKEKWVLDAGCGAGRFAHAAAKKGARLVAVDLSSAVEATAETLRDFPNVDVVQADIARLPLREGSFDYAYCIGVIQHTPDRAASLRSVVRAVKPGGKFAFTIYQRKPWTKVHGKYWARHLTKRLPNQVLLKGLERVMPALFALGERIFPLPAVGRLTRFVFPFAVYLESERPGWTREQRYRESLLDTFDMLSPRYDEPMTASEVREALAALSMRRLEFPPAAGLNVVGTR
jgi:SAM-dependent methyltransferase